MWERNFRRKNWQRLLVVSAGEGGARTVVVECERVGPMYSEEEGDMSLCDVPTRPVGRGRVCCVGTQLLVEGTPCEWVG